VIARFVVVRGRVQGVGYRWSTLRRAESLGVVGWVRNRADGAVEAHLEGDASAVAEMIEWMRTGPQAADVTELTESQRPPAAHSSFEVRA